MAGILDDLRECQVYDSKMTIFLPVTVHCQTVTSWRAYTVSYSFLCPQLLEKMANPL